MSSTWGAEPLEERPDGRDDDRRDGGITGPIAQPAQAPHELEPPAHRLHARADPLEGQRLPSREHRHFSGADHTPMSCASRSAMAPLGTATTTGCPDPCRATAAMAKGCAASPTATVRSAPTERAAKTLSPFARESSPARAGPVPSSGAALLMCRRENSLLPH